VIVWSFANTHKGSSSTQCPVSSSRAHHAFVKGCFHCNPLVFLRFHCLNCYTDLLHSGYHADMETKVKDQTGLIRRGLIYYLRVRVPSDLLDSYEKKEIYRSLRTSDKAVALQLVRIERLRLDQEFQHKRALVFSPAAAELSDMEIARLAALWGAGVLSVDEDQRISGMAEQTYDALETGFDVLEDELRPALACGDHRPLERVVTTFLKEHGIKVVPESSTHKQLCYAFTKQALRDNELLRARHGGAVVDTPQIEPVVLRGQSLQDGPSLVGLLDYWKSQRQPRPRTVLEGNTAISRFKQLHGDMHPAKIERRHLVAFKDQMLEEGKAPATVSKSLAMLRAIFEVAFINDKIPTNPAHGVKAPRAKGDKPRLPFLPEHLALIFNSPVFTQGARPKGGKGEAAYWLPLISLWTGARVSEIAQLQTGDIKEEEGIYYFHFLDDEETGKTLKRESSRRRTPVHEELIHCGLLDYWKKLSASGVGRLFPEFNKRVQGNIAKPWVQWFGRYLRKVVKVADSKRTFHSFRHGFKDACRESDIHLEIHDALTGHKTPGVGAGYGAEYFPLQPLAAAMTKLCYRRLDLSHLHRAPDVLL
jgi:integrase